MTTEISYKKDGNKSFMIIKNVKLSEEDYKLQMVLNNNIEGMISMNIKMVNNNYEIYYCTTSMISLKNMIAKNKMSGKEIYNLVKGIQRLSENMKEYLLDINGILFDMDYIYIRLQTEQYGFCYYPEKTLGFQQELKNLIGKLLEYIDYKDEEAVLIAYGMQQIVLNQDFTIQDLVQCAKSNIKGAKIEQEELNIKLPVVESIPREEMMVAERSQKGNYLLKKIKSIFVLKNKYIDEKQLEEDRTSSVYIKERQKSNAEGSLEKGKIAIHEGSDVVTTVILKSMKLKEPREIALTRFPCVVGKSKRKSDFCINNPAISRTHMRVTECVSGYFIEDLDSTNGTFVNGVRLRPHELKLINIGDQIRLANMDFIVE